MIGLIAAAAMVAAPEPTYRMNGAKLLENCESRDLASLAVCFGYINGVADETIVGDVKNMGAITLCLPLNQDPTTVRAVVLARLHQDPRVLPLPGSVAVYEALQANFSCPAKSN